MSEDKARDIARCCRRKVDARLSDILGKAETLRPVSTNMEEEIRQLMHLYPQSGRGRPSVHYVPIPYHNSPSEKKIIQ